MRRAMLNAASHSSRVQSVTSILETGAVAPKSRVAVAMEVELLVMVRSAGGVASTSRRPLQTTTSGTRVKARRGGINSVGSEPVLPSSTMFRREERRRWKMWTVEDRERYKDDGRRYPSDLTDAEWELVRSLFETYPILTRDIRAMVDGCLYLGAEGCRWRSLPKDFGPWQTVRGYWDRFRRDGVWADVAALLTPAARARLGKAPAPSTGIVDSQSVTSGAQKGERGVDGNKKVR